MESLEALHCVFAVGHHLEARNKENSQNYKKKRAANVHLLTGILPWEKAKRFKRTVGSDVPGFWLLLLLIDSLDQMIQMTCEGSNSGNMKQQSDTLDL